MRTLTAERQLRPVPTADAIRRTLDEGSFRVVFQPIVALSGAVPAGFEALARFEDDLGPEVWFQASTDQGLRVQLELAAVAKAVEEARRLPAGSFLAVNASVESLTSLPFLEALLAGPLDRLVVEVAEEEIDHPALDEVVAALRMLGVRLAVADVGTGPVGLARLADLAPEIIKIDISVVRSLAADPTARAVVAALVALAHQLGSVVVAERIETPAEEEVLRELGVGYGQGFRLGRPEPVSA